MCITPSIWPHSGGLKNCENVSGTIHLHCIFAEKKWDFTCEKLPTVNLLWKHFLSRGTGSNGILLIWNPKKESTKSVTRSGTQVRSRNLAEVAEEISWRPLWDWKSIPRKELKNHEQKIGPAVNFFVHFSVAKKQKLLTKQFHISSNWEEERRHCYLRYRLYVQ